MFKRTANKFGSLFHRAPGTQMPRKACFSASMVASTVTLRRCLGSTIIKGSNFCPLQELNPVTQAHYCFTRNACGNTPTTRCSRYHPAFSRPASMDVVALTEIDILPIRHRGGAIQGGHGLSPQSRRYPKTDAGFLQKETVSGPAFGKALSIE